MNSKAFKKKIRAFQAGNPGMTYQQAMQHLLFERYKAIYEGLPPVTAAGDFFRTGKWPSKDPKS